MNGHRTTPLRKLIRSLPDVAVEVFNRCTTNNGLNPDVSFPTRLAFTSHLHWIQNWPQDPGYAIKFDYTFLDDAYADFRPDLRTNSNEDIKNR